MSWVPKRHNLYVVQGNTLVEPLGVAMNLTGWGVRGQVRSSMSSLPEALVATFEITVLDVATGDFDARLDRAVTTELTPHTYVYDIEVYDADDTYTLFKGDLVVDGQVTQ